MSIINFLFCSGSAKLFREPVSKSNRPIIMNAVEYVVFPGVVNKDTRWVLGMEKTCTSFFLQDESVGGDREV